MIDIEFIERLIAVFDESSVDSLEIERGGTRVKLAKTPPVVAAAPLAAHQPVASVAADPASGAPARGASATEAAEPSAADSGNFVDITAPMVGTFYRSPAPDSPPYVNTGSKVSPGDTVCIIEAMKLMNELECEVSGTVVEICVENAQPVEFGQVLFRVDPG